MPPATAEHLVPDPLSFVAEAPDVDEIAQTEPEHLARTLSVYAAVLVAHDLSAAVAAEAERTST